MSDKIPTKTISNAMRQLGDNIIGQDGATWVTCLDAANRLDELENFALDLQTVVDNVNGFLEKLEAKKWM
ncbi:MAG: hypothetical protein JJW03_05170 [Desulfosarcina sp.]|nr:hypothetical protein [Desulfobacterales bacterium]